jgi:putative endonuclease
MARHNKTGKDGETLAVQYFTDKGYTILHTNWRHSHYEIDIIAYKADKLHFIEVKTRTSTKYGHPEESVDKKKMENLMKAGEEFLFQNSGWKKIQYDVLSITFQPQGPPKYFLFEDVYLYD